MVVHLVMVGDYDGDSIDSAFLSLDKAEQRRNELAAADKDIVPNGYYIVTQEVTEEV